MLFDNLAMTVAGETAGKVTQRKGSRLKAQGESGSKPVEVVVNRQTAPRHKNDSGFLLLSELVKPSQTKSNLVKVYIGQFDQGADARMFLN